MSLTVYELYNQLDKKKVSRNKSFEKVVEICFNKIRTATEKEHLRLVFDVPEYVLGLPVYNLNDCTIYIMEKLKLNGFLVRFYFPKTLYISWDLDELTETNTISESSASKLLTGSASNKLLTNAPLGLPKLSKHKPPVHLQVTTQDRLLLSTTDTEKIDARTSPKPPLILHNRQSKPNGKFTLTLD